MGKFRGMSAAQFSIVWQVDVKIAEWTLQIISSIAEKMVIQPYHTIMKQITNSFGTEEFLYRRVSKWFSIETFFATSKGGKLSRGQICC